MEWLLYLACPLMMLFCMKGMMGGGKEKNSQTQSSKSQDPNEIQQLQIQMADLMEQNHRLMEEVQSLKASNSSDAVISLEKNRKNSAIS